MVPKWRDHLTLDRLAEPNYNGGTSSQNTSICVPQLLRGTHASTISRDSSLGCPSNRPPPSPPPPPPFLLDET